MQVDAHFDDIIEIVIKHANPAWSSNSLAKWIIKKQKDEWHGKALQQCASKLTFALDN